MRIFPIICCLLLLTSCGEYSAPDENIGSVIFDHHVLNEDSGDVLTSDGQVFDGGDSGSLGE